MLQWKEYQARHWPQVKLCCSGKNTRHVIGHRSSYAAVERIPGTSLATGQAMLQWKEYQARHWPQQAMLQWKEYQARHWPQVKLCCSGKNTRHVIGHRSSYAAVERIPGTSLATGQAVLQWKEYQARHWPQVKLCCSGKNTSTCATETAHWADKVLPKTCKMGHKVQPQQNVSHESMVKMRIAHVNMAS